MVQNIEIKGIDTDDYPDFANAYICYAEDEDGTPLTDAALDELNKNRTLVYEATINAIY